jgi:hypothetical protein
VVLDDGILRYSVPIVGTDGARFYASVQFGVDGQLSGPADTTGLGATREECETGRYLSVPGGPVKTRPGRWDAQLSLCLPS